MTSHAGGRPRLPLDTDAVVTAYQGGLTLPAIATRLGVDRSRVTRAVDEAGVPRRDDRGAHWAAKRAARSTQTPAAVASTPAAAGHHETEAA